ncbi:protein kinase [Mycobacterium sp. Root265]|uniref:serine/threonine-protein kinase n=1 Tax=Mycobacterium sp. Root265 TaxID=1736504 RepID=UPI00070A2537|nr:serine/threonine-protein kinase [Mycobacterium sp. Root265]KRD13391.1 protein kinase [Mycobacterium sp. Root265]
MQGPEILGGRYELRGLLGRGGMAEVHDGWDTRLGRAVAIKLMYPALAAQPENRRRFEVEARAAARLSHPHIVAVHDSGEHDGTPYIVMERLSGRTVADTIAQGPMPLPQIRSLLDDVLSALATAHAAGILHRDIKPANILLTDTGVPKVADFGIAKSPESGHTMTGLVIGTLGYLSPERIAGRPATIADDLYAVGVLAFEALVGRVPAPHEDVAVLRPDAGPALASVVQRAIAPDPRARFADAEQMRAALSAVRPQTLFLDAPLPDPATAYVPAPTPRSRRRTLIGVAGAVLAVLVLVIAFVVDTASRSGTPTPVTTTTTTTPTPTTTTSAPLPTTTATVEQQQPGPTRGRGNGENKKGENGKGPKPKGDDR